MLEKLMESAAVEAEAEAEAEAEKLHKFDM